MLPYTNFKITFIFVNSVIGQCYNSYFTLTDFYLLMVVYRPCFGDETPDLRKYMTAQSHNVIVVVCVSVCDCPSVCDCV